jgi:hypothetical protein
MTLLGSSNDVFFARYWEIWYYINYADFRCHQIHKSNSGIYMHNQAAENALWCFSAFSNLSVTRIRFLHRFMHPVRHKVRGLMVIDS